MYIVHKWWGKTSCNKQIIKKRNNYSRTILFNSFLFFFSLIHLGNRVKYLITVLNADEDRVNVYLHNNIAVIQVFTHFLFPLYLLFYSIYCNYPHVCVCSWKSLFMHVCIFVCMCTDICIQIYMYSMYICMCVCVEHCVRTPTYMWVTYIITQPCSRWNL